VCILRGTDCIFIYNLNYLLYRLSRNTHGYVYLQLTKTMTYCYTTDRPALSSEGERLKAVNTPMKMLATSPERDSTPRRADWLNNRLTDWLAGRQTNWLIDWLTDWQTYRPTHWLTDRKTDWLTNLLTDWPPFVTRLSVWLWSLNCYSHEFHVLHVQTWMACRSW
jgi:hypothetical protein